MPMPKSGKRNHGWSMPVATLMPMQPSETAAQLANCPRTFWTILGSPVSGNGKVVVAAPDSRLPAAADLTGIARGGKRPLAGERSLLGWPARAGP